MYYYSLTQFYLFWSAILNLCAGVSCKLDYTNDTSPGFQLESYVPWGTSSRVGAGCCCVIEAKHRPTLEDAKTFLGIGETAQRQSEKYLGLVCSESKRDAAGK